MSIKRDAENFIQNQFGNSGIQGLVDMMQMNYTMRGKAAKVTGFGNEIKVNLLEADLVDHFSTVMRIINNPAIYAASDVTQAKALLEQLKTNLSQGKPRTAQDRQMFINARVTKLTFQIDGQSVVSVPL